MEIWDWQMGYVSRETTKYLVPCLDPSVPTKYSLHFIMQVL